MRQCGCAGDRGPASTIYFPVYVEGALLCLGDCHAIQSDGEIGSVEMRSEVTLRCEVIAGPQPEHDLAAHGNGGHAGDHRRSQHRSKKRSRQALREMICWIEELTGMSKHEAYLLAGCVGDVAAGTGAGPKLFDAVHFSEKIPAPGKGLMTTLAYVSDEMYVALPDVLAEFESLESGAVAVLRSSPRGAFYGDLPGGPYRVTLTKAGFGSKIVDGRARSRPPISSGCSRTGCWVICGRSGRGPASAPSFASIPSSSIS